MKRGISKLLTLLAGVTMLLSPISGYAYDRDDFDIGVNEEGDEFWYLDGTIHESCQVPISFYIYVDNSAQGFYDGLYDRAYYTFDCYTNIPEERGDGEKISSIHLTKDFFLTELEPRENLEKGDIYYLEDRIEPGDYTFCFPNAEGNNGIRTLSRDFKSPMVTDSNNYYVDTDITNKNYEVVTVYDQIGVNVYMYYGNDEWSSDPTVMSEFISWAQTNEKNWETRVMDRVRSTGIDTPFGKEDLSELKQVGQPTPTPVDDFVPANGPTRVTSTSTNVLEEFPETKAPVEEEKKSPLGVIILLALVAAGGVGAFVWYKNKQQ